MSGRLLLSSMKANHKAAVHGKSDVMYPMHNPHTELNRLIGAVAVSKRFRQTLLQNPKQVLEQGYLGYRFDLSPEEVDLVCNTSAEDIREFSLQLWEWMSRNSYGNEPSEKLPQTAESLEAVLTSIVVPTVPVSIEEKEKLDRSPFASQFTFLSLSRRVDMDSLILVVEDNREMAEGLRFALEGEGYEVALALDGDVAVEFLERKRPDLILADIKMPRMDGYALLRVVKQNVAWRDIPFVFVTAAADWREAVMAKSMGVDEYIVKPFELEDLVQVVGGLIKMAEQARIGVTDRKKRAE